MLIRLLPDGFFNRADPVLNFAGVLFSSAISFQIGVLGKLANLLLHSAFDFVELACCFVVRARFHHVFLLMFLSWFQVMRSCGRVGDPRVMPLFVRQSFAPEPVRRRASDSESLRFAGLRCWLRLCQAAMRRCVPTGSSPP